MTKWICDECGLEVDDPSDEPLDHALVHSMRPIEDDDERML